jgi:hypothetical protein
VRALPLAFATLVLAVALMLLASVSSSGAEVPSSSCPPPTALTSASTTAPPPAASAPAAVAAEPAPEQALVCVGPALIDGAAYLHWLGIAKRSTDGHRQASATELRTEVLGFLISSDWVKGEAADLGIGVSSAEVNKTYDRVRDEQFPKRGEFETFMRSSGQTVADLLWRVELNLLSARIQKHVTAGKHSASAKKHALMQFVKGFKAKWQAQTYCASGYDVTDCGHVQESV